jgi:hypothetical protein
VDPPLVAKELRFHVVVFFGENPVGGGGSCLEEKVGFSGPSYVQGDFLSFHCIRSESISVESESRSSADTHDNGVGEQVDILIVSCGRLGEGLSCPLSRSTALLTLP